MADWLYGSPIRSDPADFDTVSEAYFDRWSEYHSAVIGMRDLFDSYSNAHKGPDVRTIVAESEVVIDALASLVSGYLTLHYGFKKCADDLRSLEAEVDEPGGLGDIRSETTEPGDESSSYDSQESRGQQEFDRLQAGEVAILKTLAGKIPEAETGELADLNNPKLDAIIDKLIDGVEDPDTKMDLESAHFMLAVEGKADDDPGSALDRSEFSDQVATAMTEGAHPDDTEFAEFFPPSYTEMKDLEREIEELEADREDADGASYKWWDNDDEALANIDAQLAEKRGERDELRNQLGTNNDGDVPEPRAIGTVADLSEDRVWEGEQYAEWILEDDPGHGQPNNLEFVSARVANEPEAGLAFFNGLGPEETAKLPGRLGPRPTSIGVDPGPNREQFDRSVGNFSEALGVASKQQDEAGEPALDFTGEELIRQRATFPSPTEALFLTGDFEDQFLADATAESLRIGDEPAPGGDLTWNNMNVDPRNIMLDRSSENPETTAMVVAALEPDDVDLLLSPEHPFTPTNESTGSSLVDQENKYPITTFLSVVSYDDEASRSIFIASGNDPEPFSDPGVATGVDGIMADHATFMYDEEDLNQIGVEQTGLAEHGDPPVSESDWKATHQKVLNEGSGRALQAATKQLFELSVEAAATNPGANEDTGGGKEDSGSINMDIVEPFAIMAGAVEAETNQAAITYYADLDTDARKQNDRAALALSLALKLTPVPPESKKLGWAIWAGNQANSAADPFEAPTDNEIKELRDQLAESNAVRENRGLEISNDIYNYQLERAVDRGTIDINVDGEVRNVEIRESDDGTYQVLVDGEYVDLPAGANADGYRDVFDDTPIGNSAEDAHWVNISYGDGVLARIGDDPDTIRRRAIAGTDGDELPDGMDEWPDDPNHPVYETTKARAAADDVKIRANDGEKGVDKLVAKAAEPKDDGFWIF